MRFCWLEAMLTGRLRRKPNSKKKKKLKQDLVTGYLVKKFWVMKSSTVSEFQWK